MSDSRLAAVSWLWDHTHPTVLRLSRLASRLTGLATTATPRSPPVPPPGRFTQAEPWQVEF